MFPTKISAIFFYSFWFEFQFVFEELISLFLRGAAKIMLLYLSANFYCRFCPHFIQQSFTFKELVLSKRAAKI